MAENRYHMETSDGTKVVEMPSSAMGLSYLIGLRKGRPDLFRHQRIKSILQLHPNLIPTGSLVEKHKFTPDIQTQICDQRLLNSMMREMAFSMWAVTDKVYADGVTAMHQMYLGVDR